MSKFLRFHNNKYSTINELELINLLNIKDCDYIVGAARKIP